MSENTGGETSEQIVYGAQVTIVDPRDPEWLHSYIVPWHKQLPNGVPVTVDHVNIGPQDPLRVGSIVFGMIIEQLFYDLTGPYHPIEQERGRLVVVPRSVFLQTGKMP